MDFSVGFGYDSHRLVPGRPLVLGGVAVPFGKGPDAHSDGDVLVHALCDALLGAAALKDIGTHFPDTDEKYRQIDSRLLLRDVVRLLSEAGWQVNNADCTLILEQPKISPFADSMASCLAAILQIPVSRMSVKGKTNEKMGFVGHGEGIAATAIVSIVKKQHS